MKIYIGSVIIIMKDPYILSYGQKNNNAWLVALNSGRIWSYRSEKVKVNDMGEHYLDEDGIGRLVNEEQSNEVWNTKWKWNYECRNVAEYYRFFTKRSD